MTRRSTCSTSRCRSTTRCRTPEFEGLVDFDPNGPEATSIANVTSDLLKPADPLHPAVTTAADLLRNINAAAAALRGDAAQPASASLV